MIVNRFLKTKEAERKVWEIFPGFILLFFSFVCLFLRPRKFSKTSISLLTESQLFSLWDKPYQMFGSSQTSSPFMPPASFFVIGGAIMPAIKENLLGTPVRYSIFFRYEISGTAQAPSVFGGWAWRHCSWCYWYFVCDFFVLLRVAGIKRKTVGVTIVCFMYVVVVKMSQQSNMISKWYD